MHAEKKYPDSDGFTDKACQPFKEKTKFVQSLPKSRKEGAMVGISILKGPCVKGLFPTPMTLLRSGGNFGGSGASGRFVVIGSMQLKGIWGHRPLPLLLVSHL